MPEPDLLLMPLFAEPDTVIQIVQGFTATILSADSSGNILHANKQGSCWGPGFKFPPEIYWILGKSNQTDDGVD